MSSPVSRSRDEVREGKTPVRDQIQHQAFNLAGKAMEDKSGDRDQHQVIIARAITTKNWSDVIKKDAAEQTVFRVDMEFTLREQEVNVTPVGTQQFLVVGYAKAYLDKKYRTQDKGITKQVVGIYESQDPLPWKDDQNPTCYAVTPILDNVPDQLKYYVLLEPANELCTPYVLSKEDIFYRFEYRDTEPNIRKRASSWRDKIAQHSVRVGMQKAPSTKQETFKRALNVGKVIVEANEDAGNEMKMRALAFKKNHDVWLLKEMKKLLERLDVNLAYRPHRSNKGLRSFVDKDSVDFTTEDAAQVVLEVGDLWPDVQNMTTERVQVLKRLMHENKAPFKNFQLKGLLSEGMYRLAREEDINSIMDESEFVQALSDNLDRVLGKEAQPKAAASVMDEDSEAALLSALKAKLKSILTCYYSFSDQLNAQFGDHVLEGAGPTDFWAKYAEAPDTDSARLAFNQTAKFLVAEFTHVLSEGMVKPIHDMVKVLNRLNLSPN